MKKIILILILSISLISFVNASVSLNSVTSPEDLTQINENLKFIKDNYGADMEFVVEGSSPAAIQSALIIFSSWLNKNNIEKWNTLVYYNKDQNKLKFVIVKNCDFVYNYLKQLKEKSFIQDVLNSPNPSDSDISNMLLQISIDFKNTAQSLNKDTCSVDNIHKLQLRNNEHVVPDDVLKAMFVITMDEKWELANPQGLYVSQNFLPSNLLDFLPFVDSHKKDFYKLLQEKTTFSTSQIDSYYNIITTKGNIVLTQEYSDVELFHERVHETITDKLTSQEIQVLKDAQTGFLTFQGSTDYLYNLIAGFTSMSIHLGDWQELYAYMATYQKYPFVQNYNAYIDEEVYTLFASKYPAAQKIYQKVYNMASN